MEKYFLDKIYSEVLETVIAEKKLNENEIEDFLKEQLTEEKIQKYYKEVINKFPEDTYNYFLEICSEEYHKSQVEAQNYHKHLADIWKKGFELSNAMYLFVLEELESYSNQLEAEHGDELKDNKYKCKVLQMLANRNLQTFSAILTLLQNGFADQAYMLFRNLIENRVISQFILQNNEETDKQFYMVQVDTIHGVKQKDYEWAKHPDCFLKRIGLLLRKYMISACLIENMEIYGISSINWRVSCCILHHKE